VYLREGWKDVGLWTCDQYNIIDTIFSYFEQYFKLIKNETALDHLPELGS